MNKVSFLTELIALIANRGGDAIYPCIDDLVANGLSLDRFCLGDSRPSRQDITQYLVAWCKKAGLSEEECRNWLIGYCEIVLSSISKTSLSGIRHSTKSNVKYIYQANVPFKCDRESNPYKAQCRDNCPEYAGRQASPADKKKEGDDKGFALEGPVTETPSPRLSVEKSHQAQFEEALRVIHGEIGKGTKRKAIINLLNERGLKTITGRPWTNSSLGVQLRYISESSDDLKGGRG